ncbi:MAG: hypothetical protein KY446_01210 [Proteobacteria bacterium]|nr:hypothetical protein [Pseudomonadota bacterium]MBW3616360.1 hypothetical protein [Pseudomonadota bacterium]
MKKTAVFGAAMAVAGVFALAAAFCALYGLLEMVVDGPWAAAITALTFAAVFGVFALTHKPPKSKRSSGDDGEHHGALAGAAGAASHLPSQLIAIARRYPAAAVGVGAVAALIALRRPALMLMAATHLLGRRKKTPWERARDLLPF